MGRPHVPALLPAGPITMGSVTALSINELMVCRRPGHSNVALTTIKLAHTLAWFSIEACLVYVLYDGFVGRSDRRTVIATGVVGCESLNFAANRCRCPPTQLAERVGATRGSVTDIYLPRWFAHNLPAIHVPLIVLAVYLHWRTLRAQRGT